MMSASSAEALLGQRERSGKDSGRVYALRWEALLTVRGQVFFTSEEVRSFRTLGLDPGTSRTRRALLAAERLLQASSSSASRTAPSSLSRIT
jgi:hypothetical protein